MTTFNLLPRAAGLLFLCSLLAVVPFGAVQTDAAPLTTDDPPTLIQHLRQELQHKDIARRELALMDAIALANCPTTCTLSLNSVQGNQVRIENATGKGSVVDLTALIPSLLKTYREGPADGHRLMALTALIRIGDEKTLEQLIDEGPRQSDNVKNVTNRGLAAFYLEKYPELAENARRTGLLSLDDVNKAKSVRVRLVRKAEAQKE